MAISAVADNYTLTPREKEQMLNEADDWIDDMPDGLQDKLSDAVEHSLRGFFNELTYFRAQGIADSTAYPEVKSTIKTVDNSNINICVYNSQKSGNKPSDLLIYFHGGGWTMGSVKAYDNFCRALISKNPNVMVASVDYPLAPEKSYQEIISGCENAVNFLSSIFPGLNISLAGDGAGGNLALSTFFILNKKEPSFKIESIILYYPLLTVSPDFKSKAWKEFSRGYGLDGRVMEAFLKAYDNPAASGNFIESFSELSPDLIRKLPPTLIIMSERDIVIDDNRNFADLLNKNGVNVKSVEFSGAIHGFIADLHQPTAFNKAIDLTSAFLSE